MNDSDQINRALILAAHDGKSGIEINRALCPNCFAVISSVCCCTFPRHRELAAREERALLVFHGAPPLYPRKKKFFVEPPKSPDKI